MNGRLEVVGGAGTVIRYGGILAWAGPDASTALLGFLAQSARNLAESSVGGDLLADHVAGVLAGRDPEPHVAFSTLGPSEQGLAALLHGPVQCWDGTRWIAPSPAPGWLRTLVVARPSVTIGPAGTPTPRLRPDAALDLERGVVPGGGFVLVLRPVPAPPPGRQAPVPATPGAVEQPTAIARPSGPSPAHDSPTAVMATRAGPEEETAVMGGAAPTPLPLNDQGPRYRIDLTRVDPAQSAPLPPVADEPAAHASQPVVAGVRCSRGHFNHPDAASCSRCGTPIGGTDRAPVSGPRPALGVLVADDGGIYRLDRGYVVGAAPERDPTVTGGIARPLALPGQGVSPAHAEIRLDDWRVLLADRGSEQGTFVALPGRDRWEPVPRYQPTPLSPGTHIAFGQRVVTFTSPWPR